MILPETHRYQIVGTVMLIVALLLIVSIWL